jgi:glyoxylase-like metal-dependent hydrolase (beta-lactamase superfamily II)
MVNQELSFPFGDRRPAPGETIVVAPGVHWVRMPLPLAGLSHINLWLVEDRDGWTMVDTGMMTDEIRGQWENIFETTLGGKPVTQVICTHFHPDHVGLAGWVVKRFPGAILRMTFGEWSLARMLWLEALPAPPDEVIEFYRRAGYDGEALDYARSRGYGNFRLGAAEIPRGFQRLIDGGRVRIGGSDWTVMVGRGHSPEHACLWCPALGVMISGDQVLPRISPHIGVYPNEPDGNPLGLYLSSLERFRGLPAKTLVLPAHNDPFIGLETRLDQLAHHHAVRVALLDAAMSDWSDLFSTLPILFKRELNTQHKFMAASEALAHLHYMIAEGTAERRSDASGVFRYRRAEAATAIEEEIGHE